MLLLAGVLVGAAPIGMLVHFCVTSQVTPHEKRRWVAGLTSRQGPTLFAAYFRAPERGRATRMLTQPERVCR